MTSLHLYRGDFSDRKKRLECILKGRVNSPSFNNIGENSCLIKSYKNTFNPRLIFTPKTGEIILKHWYLLRIRLEIFPKFMLDLSMISLYRIGEVNTLSEVRLMRFQ